MTKIELRDYYCQSCKMPASLKNGLCEFCSSPRPDDDGQSRLGDRIVFAMALFAIGLVYMFGMVWMGK